MTQVTVGENEGIESALRRFKRLKTLPGHCPYQPCRGFGWFRKGGYSQSNDYLQPRSLGYPKPAG